MQHILMGSDAIHTFKMPVQMGQVREAEFGHSGIDILILLDELSGMLDLAVQEELIG